MDAVKLEIADEFKYRRTLHYTGWSKSPLTFESAAASSSEGEVGRARYGMLERSMGI